MKYEDLAKANSELKKTKIKDKEYIDVSQRIKAFRMLHPDGCIDTDMVSNEDGVCIFRAIVMDDSGRVLGTGTAYERANSNNINRTSYIENCETSAVGRALGMLGIGTDAGFASYEEVAKAQEQQQATEPQNEDVSDEIKDRIKRLKDEIKRTGTQTDAILKAYKAKTLQDVASNKKLFDNAMGRLKVTKSK